MIHIVTGNKNKYESAVKHLKSFGIGLKQSKLDIIEPQEENIEKVAKSKADQAFDILKEPVLVADTGWNISALNGFPGPFMHYVTDWFTVEDWENLFKGKAGEKVQIINVVAYKDLDNMKKFQAIRKATILEEPRGEGIPIDQLITSRTDKTSWAECKSLDLPVFEKELKDNLWTQFAEWYRDNIRKSRE